MLLKNMFTTWIPAFAGMTTAIKFLITLSLFLLIPQTFPQGSARALPTEPRGPVTGVTTTLLDLIKMQDQGEIDGSSIDSPSFPAMITLGTPAGIRIKLRYEKYGHSLIEALRASRDNVFEARLDELARYAKVNRLKAAALVGLASFNNPSHAFTLEDALAPNNPQGIRFAAVEALQIWRQPKAMELLKKTMRSDWSSLMRIFAAQAVLSMGDSSGMETLYNGLTDRGWVIRAMAARYIGDYGTADDYPKLLEYFKRETRNDFVLVELGISTLKLLSKKGDQISYTPFQKGWNENDEVRYAVGSDKSIDVEPLVIIPPRLYIPESIQIAATINNKLLDVIQNRLKLNLQGAQATDPDVEDLNSMLTPTGFALQLRYSDLGYLVVESLAGTKDALLTAELEKLARDNSNSLVRAAALISLSYSKDPNNYYMVASGLDSPDPILRFGAMEAVEVGRFDQAIPTLSFIATSDPFPAFRAYASQILMKFGDPSGRNYLIISLNQQDWIAKAMTYWYLGRYGTDSDYSYMISNLPREENPFVKTEIALALLRLTPL